jgi:hypothetical protein
MEWGKDEGLYVYKRPQNGQHRWKPQQLTVTESRVDERDKIKNT